jgi:hypothetical protein
MFFEKAGIEFAFTADGLKDKSNLIKTNSKSNKKWLNRAASIKSTYSNSSRIYAY